MDEKVVEDDGVARAHLHGLGPRVHGGGLLVAVVLERRDVRPRNDAEARVARVASSSAIHRLILCVPRQYGQS